ncbi:MAG: MFS transporter [Verrucomicrobia bacterium]|nr:MFS transporter [Verrucomicrobiota bacterium]
MADLDRRLITYRYERWRALSAGILETASGTFLLLIAVRWFNADPIPKALVAAGGSFGLLLSPLVVYFVSRLQWPAARAAARARWVGAGAVLVAALFPVLPVYVAGAVLGAAVSASVIPLLTQMYQENYPDHERGRLFSRAFMIRIATAAVFSKLAGEALSRDLGHFPWLLAVFALALAGGGWLLARCPSRPLVADGGAHPLRGMRFVREDALFRRTLICWMLMGFANLMMLPLRIEYLANPKYDLGLTVGTIALLTGVIPNAARLVLSPIWGRLFDRMNFFSLRITLNIGFALGTLTFFTSDNLFGLVAAAVIYGVSAAGGDVAWSLWVTKFAPPERVADYMSVHTFLTGVRGVLAPVVAFSVVTRLPLATMALISVGLIMASTLMLVPEIKFGKRARPTSVLVEEVSE